MRFLFILLIVLSLTVMWQSSVIAADGPDVKKTEETKEGKKQQDAAGEEPECD